MLKGLIASVALASSVTAAAAPVEVAWQNLMNRVGADGKPEYVQRFIIKGDLSNLSRIAFNQFDRKMTPVNSADTVGRIIPGYYYIASPRFAQNADSVVVDIVTSGTMPQYSYGADGVHGVNAAGEPFDVEFIRLSGTMRPEQWTLPGRDRNTPAEKIFEKNEELINGAKAGAYDIVPSFKSVKLGEGIYTGGDKTLKLIKHENPEFYRITVTPQGITTEGASQKALYTASRTLDKLLRVNGGKLPAAVIEDYPDYGYRGVMIDIARNYQSLDQMKKFVDVMADYRLNRLQFHFIDDEAWRLEIPGLPELTEYGSRRGYTTDEKDFLAQIYAGDGRPSTLGGTANGYITRQEFIDFLKYCDARGVTVIPEIETPGHARAARKSMEARYRKTGDDTYRLIEDGDTSVYRSAQDFGDNVMNPAVPGTLRFMEKVFDEIIAMYKDAGVNLETIHIGGDEVPHGAWSGSPSAIKFMKENNMKSESDLHAYFVKQLGQALKDRGLKMSGWQEVVLGKDEATAKSISPYLEFVNLWVTWPQGKEKELPAIKAQQLGAPVVFSTAHGFYLDQPYSGHPDERGLGWAMITDELASLDAYPAVLAPQQPGGKILGVQGQLWSETVRGPQQMEWYLFPKMLGMVERAWNSDTTYTHSQFNSALGKHELPFLAQRGVNFHLRQPGVKIENGKILMNSPYEGAEIRYTVDGTDPDINSTLYTGAVDVPQGAGQIRARLYYLGKESVSTMLDIAE